MCGAINRMLHNFKDSLEKSDIHSDDPLWGDLYQAAFHNFAGMHKVGIDGWAQRGGIDRIIMLNSGKTLSVDEKVREKDYGDILLEFWSNFEKKVPGWVAKDLACDFIAYAIMPARKCYLLNFQLLREAWIKNHKEWVGKYQIAKARNIGYTTISVCVPVDVLFEALSDVQVVQF